MIVKIGIGAVLLVIILASGIGGIVLGNKSNLIASKLPSEAPNQDLAEVSVYPASTSPDYEADLPGLAVDISDSPFLQVKVEGDFIPDTDVIIGTFAFAAGTEDLPRLYQFASDGVLKGAWEIERKSGTILGDRRMLDDGRIMFTLFKDGTYILNPETNEIDWYYLDKSVSHHAELLSSGEVLTVGSYCDCIKLIDYETKEINWQWSARDTFKPYNDEDNYPGGEQFNIVSPFTSYVAQSLIFPDDWTHINHAQWLEDTDTFIVSLRNFDLVAEIDRSGTIIWSYGPGIIKQQHTPRVLDDGTMVLFDNGNHRAIRIDRGTQEILWEKKGLYAPVMGDVSLLDDGNYKVVDSIGTDGGSILIVTPENETIWKFTPWFPANGNGVNIYRAHLPGLE